MVCLFKNYALQINYLKIQSTRDGMICHGLTLLLRGARHVNYGVICVNVKHYSHYKQCELDIIIYRLLPICGVTMPDGNFMSQRKTLPPHPAGRTPGGDADPGGEIMSLHWPGNTSGSPSQS